MVRINNIPILIHIMKHYHRYGFSNFCIALGYKGSVIKKFFKEKKFKWCNVNLIDTGKDVMTGGRLKRLKKYLQEDENFLLTYGDGVSNVNIRDLVKFHTKHKKIGTMTAVRPPVKFGELTIGKKNKVIRFIEKPQLNKGWINGGFFVLNKKIFKYLRGNNLVFEKEPLTNLCKDGELKAFMHNGYWRCMDNINEKNQLEEIFKKKKTIWKIK